MIVHVDEAGRDYETPPVNYARARRNSDASTRACRSDTIACDYDNRVYYRSAP
jgi:hypothetical protein